MVNGRDVALLGIIPIKIVKRLSHTLGNVAVGHAVGKGVRIPQIKSSPPPERIQMVATLLGDNRFIKKVDIEKLYFSRLPFPFISGLTAIPLMIIQDLTFIQSADVKDLEGGPIVDFVITLSQFKLNVFLNLGVKLAWLNWMLATKPDVATGVKLITTPPDGTENSAIITTDTIIAEAIDFESSENLGEVTVSWIVNELVAANTLNKKFDALPIDPNGIFPQVIKLNYPPTTNYSLEFNDIPNLPDDYSGYEFPPDSTFNATQIIIKFIAKEDIYRGKRQDGSYYTATTMIVIDSNGNEIFNRIIVPEKVYSIGIYSFTFNEVDVHALNINPENLSGGDFGSKLSGGIRIE